VNTLYEANEAVMSNDILVEILKEVRELRQEFAETRILAERNAVSLEEHMRRTSLAEKRLELMEDHIIACPARKDVAASKILWERIKNWSIAASLAVVLLTQLIPWLRGK
jgi:hypothetical protein